jgi:hypothetical protein
MNRRIEMAVKIHNVYSPEQYKRVVELWRRLLDSHRVTVYEQCGWDKYMESVDDEYLYELVMSNGEETEDVYPVKVSLVSYSDYGGSDLDAANVRALGRLYGWVSTHTGGPRGEGEAWVNLGELPPDLQEDVEWRLDQLAGLVETLEELDHHALIDDEIHSEYVSELAEEAWDQYLGWDAVQDLTDYLLGTTGYDLEDFKFSDDEIRDLYYEFTSEQAYGPHCDSATSVVFPFHDEVIDLIGKHIVKAWRTPVVDPNQLSLSV